jgi:DNA-binding NarL/FixJ family response regulator
MESLNILHANPQTLARVGLKIILNKSRGINAVDEVGTTDELTNVLLTKKYDLIIVDYDRHHSFSYQDITNIQKICPRTKILVVSSEKDNQEINKILTAGINGCVTTACSETEMVNAIFSVSKGEKFFCNKIVDLILNQYLNQNGTDQSDDCDPTILSPREIEITRLIAEGFTNKQVAQKLFLSIHTIHTHRKNIMKKLGIKSTSDLVRYAISVGIIHPV